MRSVPLLIFSKAVPWLWCLVVLLGVACSGSKSGKSGLVLYSTHGKELLTEFENSFESEHPEVDIRWLDMGSQDVLDRLRSERENPQADIWWGAPSTIFQQGEKEGLLQPYRPSWSQKVQPEARSSGDFWYGTYETPEVIAYNSSALKPEEAPQDWDDLLDPKWRNKIILRDPLASGTMRTIFCAMILRFYDNRSPEVGYEWLRKLDANTKDYVANLTLLTQKIARQEALVTLWNLPDVELQRTQYHYPLSYIIPKSGTPIVTDGIAIVKGTKNQALAELFYEHVTDPQSLLLAANRFYRIPCRTDIEQDSLPAWIRAVPLRTMQLDWKLLEEKSGEWMRFWDVSIRNRSKR